MDKTKLIELIDNNVTYHTQSENVKIQFPTIKEQISIAIDLLIQQAKEEERERCAKIVEKHSHIPKELMTNLFVGIVDKVMCPRIKSIAKAIREE